MMRWRHQGTDRLACTPPAKVAMISDCGTLPQNIAIKIRRRTLLISSGYSGVLPHRIFLARLYQEVKRHQSKPLCLWLLI